MVVHISRGWWARGFGSNDVAAVNGLLGVTVDCRLLLGRALAPTLAILADESAARTRLLGAFL